MPVANASSPTRSGGQAAHLQLAPPPAPRSRCAAGRGRPAGPARPAAASCTTHGLRVLRAMNSAIGQSAMSLPRADHEQVVGGVLHLRHQVAGDEDRAALGGQRRMRFRIHRMPSGSRPLTGSSNIRISGSPSSAAAMPSRWLMPSEKPLDRLPATSASPTIASTSSTRLRGMSLVCARHSRWLYGAAAAVHRLRVQQRADLAHRAVQLGERLAVDRDRPAWAVQARGSSASWSSSRHRSARGSRSPCRAAP